MRLIRESLLFVVWLFLGWLWLMVASLLIGGLVAFTIEYFFVTPSSPPFVGYLVSGLSLFAAALLVLFSTAQTKRLGRGALVAILALGMLDVATSLLTRFGYEVPRIGYTFALSGASLGIGSQLVNGVALLAGAAVFLFVRSLGAAESSRTAPAEDAGGASDVESTENEAPGESQASVADEVAEEHPNEDAARVDANEAATSYII
jgi:hypothetical protein